MQGFFYIVMLRLIFEDHFIQVRGLAWYTRLKLAPSPAFTQQSVSLKVSRFFPKIEFIPAGCLG